MAKQLKHGEEARKALQKGVDVLANTVKIIIPKVHAIKETAIIPMIIFLCFLKNSIISPLIHPIFYYQKNLCARN